MEFRADDVVKVTPDVKKYPDAGISEIPIGIATQCRFFSGLFEDGMEIDLNDPIVLQEGSPEVLNRVIQLLKIIHDDPKTVEDICEQGEERKNFTIDRKFNPYLLGTDDITFYSEAMMLANYLGHHKLTELIGKHIADMLETLPPETLAKLKKEKEATPMEE